MIGSLDPAQMGDWLLVILQVALGLGTVIFVHELGHFAVAKMCGVKCEKFFVGFDIGGYKISRKWGETEYGIGILPLGGYVKMLGQDDNPANIAEQVRESEVSGGGEIESKEITGPDGKTYLVDKRSYLAKSVPQRMAIISAGVIMNIIFAVIFAVIAFGIGVPYIPSVVSHTTVGSASWEAGLRTGDEIIQIGDIENPSFTELKGGVTLGDLENGIPFVVRRADTGEVERLNMKPKQGSGMAKVGMFLPKSLRMSRFEPVLPDSPAASAEKKFEPKDEIIAVDGTKVDDYRQFSSLMLAKADQPVNITVRRGGTPPENNPFGPTEGGEEVTIEVAPRPMLRLGLMMEKGKVAAVESGSEAEEKGITPGDFIDDISFADQSADEEIAPNGVLDDPISLPYQLAQLAEENRAVRLKVRHSSSGSDEQSPDEEIDLPLRKVDWVESSVPVEGEPLSIPAMGIAMHVLNRVDEVVPDSPAAKAGLQNSDVITKAEFILPKSESNDKSTKEIDFTEKDKQNWPSFILGMQNYVGAKVKLTYQRGDKVEEVTLEPEPIAGQFLADRGFNLEPTQEIRIANSFQEQVELGWNETVRSLTLVYRFLNKLITGQVPATSLGGPVTIAQAAGYSAFEGVGKLLVFLTMLSANLAVINFLPIPLLDGGHMVFLAYEGLRGRPANERFVVALHTVGFVCIVSLMLFVLSLDFGFIERSL